MIRVSEWKSLLSGETVHSGAKVVVVVVEVVVVVVAVVVVVDVVVVVVVVDVVVVVVVVVGVVVVGAVEEVRGFQKEYGILNHNLFKHYNIDLI